MPSERTPKRVFITGGSSGIGLALADALVRAGAHVCICARGQARLDEAVAALEAAAPRGADGPAPFGVRLDISDREAVGAAAAELGERLGGLDLLINNAGVAHPGPFLELEPARFDEMMDINYHGTVNVTRALVPTMIDSGGGQIAMVSSLAAIVGIYGYTAYAPSKYAVRGFAECLRHDLMGHDITVHTAFPPDTDTPQLAYEDRFKPAETKALGGSVEALTAEAVARTILDGLARGRTIILPGLETKLVYWAARRFPGLTRYFTDATLRKVQRGLPPER